MTEIRADQVQRLTRALAAHIAAVVWHGRNSIQAARAEAVASAAARNSSLDERRAAAAGLLPENPHGETVCDG